MTPRETRLPKTHSQSSTKRRALGWPLFSFVMGVAVTYAATMVLALNKPDGLRGARVGETYFDIRENDMCLDLIIVGVEAVVIGILMFFRDRLGFGWGFILGQWMGLLVSMAIILFS